MILYCGYRLNKMTHFEYICNCGVITPLFNLTFLSQYVYNNNKEGHPSKIWPKYIKQNLPNLASLFYDNIKISELYMYVYVFVNHNLGDTGMLYFKKRYRVTGAAADHSKWLDQGWSILLALKLLPLDCSRHRQKATWQVKGVQLPCKQNGPKLI